MASTGDAYRVLAHRFIEAHNAHDPRRMCGLVSSDFEYRDPAAPEPVRSAAELERMYDGLFAAFPDLHFRVTSELVGSDGVFLVLHTTGRGTGVWAGKDMRGRRIEVEEACLFRFAGSRIALVHFFSDTLTLDRQLGGYH
jgi:predicted ester cyclase